MTRTDKKYQSRSVSDGQNATLIHFGRKMTPTRYDS